MKMNIKKPLTVEVIPPLKNIFFTLCTFFYA
uniref:Uncharacterized protein n=1 Tax=viral metagenome TaxID=1070528 RepID=A0A6C0J1S1_9ZZZZ